LAQVPLNASMKLDRAALRRRAELQCEAAAQRASIRDAASRLAA
jgi:hypothetical protein